MQMVDEKAPILDGFPCEFYKACWDFLGSNLHKVYLEVVQLALLGSSLTKGILSSSQRRVT